MELSFGKFFDKRGSSPINSSRFYARAWTSWWNPTCLPLFHSWNHPISVASHQIDPNRPILHWWLDPPLWQFNIAMKYHQIYIYSVIISLNRPMLHITRVLYISSKLSCFVGSISMNQHKIHNFSWVKSHRIPSTQPSCWNPGLHLAPGVLRLWNSLSSWTLLDLTWGSRWSHEKCWLIWGFDDDLGNPTIYPLVNIQKAIEHGHL